MEGQHTDVFRKQQRGDLADVSFSLIYPVSKRKERTLDVVCKDSKEYGLWVSGLRYLISHTPPEEALREHAQSVGSAAGDSPGAVKSAATKTRNLSADLKKTLKESSDVYSWGGGSWGQLGSESDASHDVPHLVRTFLGKTVKRVSCGYEHTGALTGAGELYMWGNGGGGRLGTGTARSEMVPRRVCRLLSADETPYIFADVSCGGAHTVAVTQEGEAYSWGTGNLGQLGHGDFADVLSPKFISATDGSRVLLARAGADASALVVDGGILMTFGCGDDGLLGHGDERGQGRPTRVSGLSSEVVASVEIGDMHMAVVTEAGEVYTWGWNGCGQLGHGDFEPRLVPTKVRNLYGVESVGCGAAHTVALVDAAKAAAAAAAAVAAVAEDEAASPVETESSSGGAGAAAMASSTPGSGTGHQASEDRSPAKGDTRLYAWGSSTHGQLGTRQMRLGMSRARSETRMRTSSSESTPDDEGSRGAVAATVADMEEACVTAPKVVNTLLGLPITQIACGAHHTAVVTGRGVLYMMGDARYGQLGVKIHEHTSNATGGAGSMPASRSASLSVAVPPAPSVAAPARSATKSLLARGASFSLSLADLNVASRDRATSMIDPEEAAVRDASAATGSKKATMYDGTTSIGPQIVANLVSREVRDVSCGGKHTVVTVATQWIRDDEAASCMRCGVGFTTFIRRHHCRNCGGVFCGKCSARRLPLLKLGFIEPVRVCETCYQRIVSGAG